MTQMKKGNIFILSFSRQTFFSRSMAKLKLVILDWSPKLLKMGILLLNREKSPSMVAPILQM